MRKAMWLGITLVVLLGLSIGAIGIGYSAWAAGPKANAVAPGCTQVVANSDFEGTGGWTEFSSLGVSLISDFPPPSGSYHSGSKGAYLADYNNAHDYIEQTVTIPADATQATLSYWWQVETGESTLQPYDVLTVTLLSPQGTTLATLGTISNQDAGALWQETTADLLAYKGQSVTLRFEARTDANRPTAFYLDDITLEVCTPQATATPTPTATATPTNTPTPAPTNTPTPTSTPTPLPSQVVVAVVPETYQAAVASQAITLSIDISNVVDLGGFEFTLSFDPAVVQASTATLGDFLASTGRSVSALPVQVDNINGTLTFGAFSFGTGAGPSGAGTLAQVVFTPRAVGTTTLTLQKVQVTNTSGNVFNITTRDGQLTISDCSPYDLDCDGDVDVVDIMTVASHWGCEIGDACYDAKYDLHPNGRVDIVDIMQVAAHWGCTSGDACYWPAPRALPRGEAQSLQVVVPTVRVPDTASSGIVPVQVRDAVDLGAVEMVIQYDPRIVQVEAVTAAGFLGQNGREEVLLPPQVDNQKGVVRVGLFSYGNGTGASGSGDLLYLKVRPASQGTTTLRLNDVQAVTAQAQAQAAQVLSGEVQVVPGRGIYIPVLLR